MTKISRMVLGTMVLKLNKLDFSFKLLDDAMKRGICTFDTAKVYGDSEYVLGKWIAERKNRDKIVILTKGAHHNDVRKRVTPFDIMSDLYDSLAKLQTDYIDIYMLHRDDETKPVSEIMDTLNKLYDDKLILNIGVSNWTTARIREANEYAKKNNLQEIKFISPQFSVARQVLNPWGTDNSDCVAADDEMINYCEDNNIQMLTFSSLARGFMSGAFKHNEKEKAMEILDKFAQRGYFHEENLERLKRVEVLANEKNLTVPQTALSYVMSKSDKIHPIFTAMNEKEMDENIASKSIKLTSEECNWINLK